MLTIPFMNVCVWPSVVIFKISAGSVYVVRIGFELKTVEAPFLEPPVAKDLKLLITSSTRLAYRIKGGANVVL